jgi:hypothetical protein
MGGGSIELDGSRSMRAIDHIGLEALPVPHIPNQDLLVR